VGGQRKRETAAIVFSFIWLEMVKVVDKNLVFISLKGLGFQVSNYASFNCLQHLFLGIYIEYF